MDKRFEIEFEYKDKLSHGNWNRQSCSLYANDKYDAIQQCKDLYGLGIDCEYNILGVQREGEELL